MHMSHFYIFYLFEQSLTWYQQLWIAVLETVVWRLISSIYILYQMMVSLISGCFMSEGSSLLWLDVWQASFKLVLVDQPCDQYQQNKLRLSTNVLSNRITNFCGHLHPQINSINEIPNLRKIQKSLFLYPTFPHIFDNTGTRTRYSIHWVPFHFPFFFKHIDLLWNKFRP